MRVRPQEANHGPIRADEPGHWFVRDGSWWVCRNRGGTTRPFPSPVPKPEELGPCVPADHQARLAEEA